MAKIVISRSDQSVQEVELLPGRMALGRHPYNDIVIDNPAVSSEHAAFEVKPTEVLIEDLDSTNGTFVNGQRVSRRVLKDGDNIVVGRCRIAFSASFAQASPVDTGPLAVIDVISGPNAGKSLRLDKPVSTLGKPGVQVIAITRQGADYFVHHVEGGLPALVNGTRATALPHKLTDGDAIELVGTGMRFRLPAG